MSQKTLQLSEQALRLALALAALALAAWMGQSHTQGKQTLHASLPKPGLVMEW
ncbi:MAG TPA: hypothetical protein VNZ54_04850 [bacterium]|jgi:hypothetical protein|nr:hypothetical protein [bacterium]HXB97358.1 hypothetical protein [bacterium]